MARLPIERLSATSVMVGGRELIAFAGCNYLGLSQHPGVVGAMTDAAGRFGISTAAARQTTGNTVVHDQLEKRLAAFVGMPDAVLLPDGYTANVAALQALAGERTAALMDARAHRSLHDAAVAAEMSMAVYEHLNVQSAAKQLREHTAGRAVVLTDGVFAADGAVAMLGELVHAAAENDGLVLVDDCHGAGILGPGGRGSAAHAALDDADRERLIITGTLAKGLGCYGGFVAAPEWICQLVRRRSSVYQTTTPVPPALAAAGLEALAVLRRDPTRLERLRRNTGAMRQGLSALGIPLIDTPAPIFAFILKPPELMNAVRDSLPERGYLAPILSYPQGPGERYFRLSVTSEHTEEQIAGLLGALGRVL